MPTPTTPSAPSETDRQLAEACKALAHPARLAILRQLLRENRCICGRIVDVLPLAQSTVSQHLKILKEAGLIHGEVEGPSTCYCANREKLEEISRNISAISQLSSESAP